MLRRLTLANLALVDHIEMNFSPGLNVITGETGAGKSVVLESLLLLAGKRSSSNDIRIGATQIRIEAELELKEKAVRTFLDNLGISYDGDTCLLRRIITKDQKSRAWINDQSCTLATLSDFSEFWLDVTGQHAQHNLRQNHHLLEILDQFSKSQKELESYQTYFAKAQVLQQKYDDLETKKNSTGQELEFFKYQVQELRDAKLSVGEMESLESACKKASIETKMAQSVSKLLTLLEGEADIIQELSRIKKEVSAFGWTDRKTTDLLVQIQQTEDSLKELRRNSHTYTFASDFDGEQIDAMNERMAFLQRIARKYGSIDEAIAKQLALEQEIASRDHLDGHIFDLRRQMSANFEELKNADQKLSELRKKGAALFEQLLAQELAELSMPHAQLAIEFGSWLDGSLTHDGIKYGPMGSQRVSFLFSANPGVPLFPLEKIASGGEFARVLLAIKALGFRESSFSGTKIYVFDEVDQGIGGPTADRVGLRLKSLAQAGQVLCVTHLAQVASYAQAHFLVEKKSEQNKTQTYVRLLDKTKEREEELARMIGGVHMTPAILTHAKELLGKTRSAKKKNL